MSHEDYMQPEELARERERFSSMFTQRETSVQVTATLETMGYYTVKLPKPVLWALLYLLIGFGIGYFGYHVLTVSPDRPAPVVPTTETLADFVTRESQGLSANERIALIAITKQILLKDFATPSALREEFYYQRLKAGLHDSPSVNTFWDKWAMKVTDMKIEENVESMREVYTQLLHGLQQVKSYIDISGVPVEGFLRGVSPSIIDNTLSADVDEPVTSGVVNHKLSTNAGADYVTNFRDPEEITKQRQRIFRRR